MTLQDFTIGTAIPNDGWMQLTIIKGKVQQEVVHIFYSNIYNSDVTCLSFKIEVYNVWMFVNPNRIAMLLGINRPTTDVTIFPN